MEKIKYNTASKVLVVIPVAAAVLCVVLYAAGYFTEGEMSLPLIFLSAAVSLILPLPLFGVSIAALVTALKARKNGAPRTEWRIVLSIIEGVACLALAIFWTTMFIYDTVSGGVPLF